MPKTIAKKVFTAELFRQGSWGAQRLGRHKSTMELIHPDFGSSEHPLFLQIEWDIPALDDVETIGLAFKHGKDGKFELVDYDGVFSLPEQAIDLLRESGYIVGEEFQ